MSDLLLEDPANPDEAMDDLSEKYLIEVMSCCVKQAATGEYPIARRTQTTQRKLTNKEQQRVQDDRVDLTQHFITALPELLTKYIADQEKLVYLLQIPLHFDLNQYTLRRQEKALDNLLKLIQEIVSKHNESDVLEECSKCLAYLCDEDNPTYSRCNVIRSTILDNLVDQFTVTLKHVEELSEVDDNDIYPLCVALKRLSAFAQNHDVSSYDLVKNVLTTLRWANDNEGFPLDFVSKALQLTSSILSWNLNKLYSSAEEAKINNMDDTDYASVNQESIDYVSKLSKKYYKICTRLMVNENPGVEEEAYFELCDLFLMFNMHLIQTHKDFKSLILECSTNDIYMLSVYVMNNVFTQEALNEKPDTAENIEKLHKRRSILAAFCKLICYNCIPIKFAAEIFRGYAKYAMSYGDITKQLLSTCREISKVNTAKTIALALQREYNEAVMNQSQQNANDSILNAKIDRFTPEFVALKELARKFILSFGPDAGVKSREAIVAIHNEAIAYSNQVTGDQVQPKTANQAPPNLPFLEVIIEFSSRLNHTDKKNVLTELDRLYAKRANKLEENNWEPYYNYRRSLMEDSSTNTNNQTAATNRTVNNTTAGNNTDLTYNSLLNGSTNRKRKSNDSSLNMSGVSRLKDSLIEKNKSSVGNSGSASGPLGPMPDIEEGEEEENEDEEVENIQNKTTQITNTHTNETTNDLENLKLSTINGGPDSTRLTRSAKKINPLMNKVNNANNNLIRNSPGKRSRSPLVTANGNNTIDDSSMMNETTNCVLSSTRIVEPNKLIKKNAMAIRGDYNSGDVILLEEQGDETIISDSQQQQSKRKRKTTRSKAKA
jgi:cohesin complex subunit SA-1/2